MELFTNASREHLVNIIEDFTDQIFENYEGSIGDVVSELYAVGFTRQEILDVLNRRYLDSYEWSEEETETAPIPTEEVNVGDSDQAILETALTQISIKYEYHDADDDINWVEIKDTNVDSWSAEFQFDKDGRFLRFCL